MIHVSACHPVVNLLHISNPCINTAPLAIILACEGNLFKNMQFQLPSIPWIESRSLDLLRPYYFFFWCISVFGYVHYGKDFSLFPFKEDLPETYKQIRKEKKLNVPASPFPNSCLLYFYLKYLWTWNNIYFYDEHNLGVKNKRTVFKYCNIS